MVGNVSCWTIGDPELPVSDPSTLAIAASLHQAVGDSVALAHVGGRIGRGSVCGVSWRSNFPSVVGSTYAAQIANGGNQPKRPERAGDMHGPTYAYTSQGL